MEDKFVKLPFPPSIWTAYYRKGNSSFKTKEYRSFEVDCLAALRRANFLIDTKSKLEIQIILFSDRWLNKDGTVKQRDLDNYLKCLIDCVVVHLRKKDQDFDDKMIFSIYAEKRVSADQFALLSVSARKPRDEY